MARALTFLIPGDLTARTGGYEYDRRIAAGVRDLGWHVETVALDGSYPQPSAAARQSTASLLAALPAGALVMIDGLAFGAMADEAARETPRLRLVALVHHPLARETGIDARLAAALEDSERRALACACHVVVTSAATSRALERYGVAPGRISVVEPGTDAAPLARGSGGPAVHMIAVGSIVPRKGFEVLIEAMAMIRDRPWRLTCAGSLDRAPATASRVQALVDGHGLRDRVSFAGELAGDRLAALYDRADLFVLPTFYEGYGMVVAEALARGLPVISTPTGGIPQLVSGDAGILVPVADARALADAVARFIGDETLRARLRAGAERRRDTLPSWAARAREMAAVLGNIVLGS